MIQSLEKIRTTLALSKENWSSTMGITEEQYERILRNEEPVSAMSIYRLTERFNINPTSFENGHIDYSALLQAEKGNNQYLNPRYLIAAHSRKHTVINALTYVSKYHSAQLTKSVHRHFQIPENFWHDKVDRPINIRFVTELLDYLKTHNFKERQFREIGFHSSLTLRHSPIGHTLSSFNTLYDVFECMFSDFMANFEHNCSYQITRLDSGVCVVESRSKSDVAEALAVQHVGSQEGCQVRAGIFSALPTYLGYSAASVHETHCVHRGDSCCRFVMDFSETRFTKTGLSRLTSVS